MKQTMMGVLLLAGAQAWADGQGLGPYQVIVDKSPFGSVTPVAGAATPAAMSRFAFVGLVQSGDGQLLAIIQDKQTKQCYFKAEGEAIDDVKVQKIEEALPARRLILRRGLETGTLSYEERRATAPTMAPPPAPGMPGVAVPLPATADPATTTPPPRRIPFRR
jgi:hypothetical protein